MSEEFFPVIGEWYKSYEGQIFKVVATDEAEKTIEIQYFGGEIDEIEADAWESSVAEKVEQPEDWSGPYDDLEKDDLGYTDMGLRPDSYSAPIEEID